MSLPAFVKPVQLTRAAPARRRRAGAGERSIHLAALRAPLVIKLVGANLLVVGVLVTAWLIADGMSRVDLIAALTAIVILVQLALVLVALRPVHELETVASRVWHGDYGARVERSEIADQEVLRVGSMFNILLDGLSADRARMRALATQVIAVSDRERAALARELHESTAQRVAALLFNLSLLARETTDPRLAEGLHEARDATEVILEELRALSHTVHTAVLDDLGLAAALRRLGRDASHGTGVDVDVSAEDDMGRLPPTVESVLFRVAQEATRNAIRHGAPQHVRISVDKRPSAVTLEVHDDGAGFDLAKVRQRGDAMGLLSMTERVALIDGLLDIHTAPGCGTTVSATVPLAPERDAFHED
jgi:signal transduction histidine kinase